MDFKQIIQKGWDNGVMVLLGLLFLGGSGAVVLLGKLQDKIEEGIRTSSYLNDQLRSLNAKIVIPGPKGNPGPKGDPGPAVYLPAGAVVAFDRSSGCPTGWAAYPPAQGRSIVGAVPGGAQYYDLASKYSDFPKYSDYPNEPARTPLPAKGKALTFEPLKGKEYVYDPSAKKGNTYEFDNFSPDNPAPNNQDGLLGYVSLLYCKKLPE